MEKMKEVEIELTLEELKLFADYCLRHEIKFNDWIRSLAHEAIKNESTEKER